MDGSSEEEPEVVGEPQAVVPGAAEASSEPLQGSILPQGKGAAPGVVRASVWDAGACLV